MPLSEHEQRMLAEIESALYAEDPKFVSNVSKARGGHVGFRRRVQAGVVMALGLVLLVVGLMAPVQIGDFKILSLVGFLVMFVGAMMLLFGGRGTDLAALDEDGNPKRRGGGKRRFGARMEERYNQRFQQHDR